MTVSREGSDIYWRLVATELVNIDPSATAGKFRYPTDFGRLIVMRDTESIKGWWGLLGIIRTLPLRRNPLRPSRVGWGAHWEAPRTHRAPGRARQRAS